MIEFLKRFNINLIIFRELNESFLVIFLYTLHAYNVRFQMMYVIILYKLLKIFI